MLLVLFTVLFIGSVFAQNECLNNGVLGPTKDKCYHFISVKQNYEDAEVICGMFNSVPVSITSGFESQFVLSAAHESISSEFWIGLTDLYNENIWRWMDGKQLEYTNWGTGFPKNDTTKRCVAVQWSGKWMNVDCSSYSAYFVCQSLPPIEDHLCMPPSIEGPNGCYHVNIVRETYEDAEAICGQFGGNLAQIVNEEQAQNLMGTAKEHFYKTDYWIGISDPYDSGTWQYIDGTAVNFTHWASGFPIPNNTMLCVAARLYDARWYNSVCNVKKASVCQQPHWVGSSNPWIYFHKTGYLYKIFYELGTIDEYEERCVALGAHLVSIHSFEESMFVAGIAIRSLDDWVATGGRLVNNQVIWTDGTPLDYQLWYGDTATPFANEPCVHIWSLQDGMLKWANHPCNIAVGPPRWSYVCKRRRFNLNV